MAEASGVISGFKITNYYKFILYVAGVILILSLFVDAPGIDNKILREKAFWVVLAGIIVWAIDDILCAIESYLKDSTMSKTDYEFWDKVLVAIFLVIQFSIWFIVLTTIILPKI